MTPNDEANAAARRGRGWAWLGQLGHDFAFSIRTLQRTPGFSLAVVITLALCIGANTAILSTLYALVLRPPPVRDADQVVEIYNYRDNAGLAVSPLSVAQYVDYKENADLLSGVSLYQEWNVTFGKDYAPARFFGARVSPDYFEVLRLDPIAGRFFGADSSTAGNDRVIVLSQSFWEEQYRSDPAVIGQPIELTGETFTIIGVAPRAAECVDFRCRVFRPYTYDAGAPGSRAGRSARAFGRLKPGTAPAQALAQLEMLDRRFYEQQADPATRAALDRSGQKVRLGRVRDVQAQDVKPGLISLQAGVLFVLLIGCVNVANLMLARFNSRQAELGIRQALGASRGVIVRQLLAEAMVLAAAGAAAGITLAWVGLRVINTYVAQIVISAAPVAIDGRILGWTLLIALGVAFLIGLLPCLQLWSRRAPAGNVLGPGGARGSSGSRGMRRVSAVLVTAQFAIALVLLVGAGLLLRSFANVIALDPGIDGADRIFIGRTSLPPSYRTTATLRAFEERTVAKLREIPGAEIASVSHQVLINKNFLPTAQFYLPPGIAADGNAQPVANFLSVSPEFLDTFKLKLIAGRNLTPADDAQAQKVVLVDRGLAEKYFPGRSAVGEKLGIGRVPANSTDWSVIVGVVEKASFNGLEDRARGLPFAFGAVQQAGGTTAMSVFVRMRAPTKNIFQLVHAKLREIDPSLPLYYAGTAREKLDEFLANRRGIVLLLGALSLLALLLAGVGIYGVLAYDVSQRTREIGIRGALGATRGEIIGLIARQGMKKAAVGLVLGLIGAFFLTRFVRSLLYDVQPTDPVAYLGVSLLLLGVALLASYLPARRAAKIDPIVLLRYE